MEPLAADDPRVLGGYRLLGRLGAGGMGRVYLGRSAGGRTVAVKAVHAQYAADEQFRARFRREVAAARRVGGAWTAPVLDADPDAAVPWVATGYVAGPSLTRVLADHGPLATHSVRALGAGLAEALTAVHALGLVHRDVKPSNVLLTLDGPRLIDFGIARATDGTVSLTATGASVGSPGYMAPEQILGNGAEGAADVFSLGAVLAFAATGTSPFPGDSSAALLYKVVHEEPELGPELTGPLRELVAACLAKDPARRPTPEAVAARLAGGASGGAAALVRAGWLPGPLVEQVSRQAVALLDLDAGVGDGDGDGGEGAPGTVGAFGAGGVGLGAAGSGADGPVAGGADASGPLAGTALPGGAFGPPDPSYGGGAGAVSGTASDAGAASGTASGLIPFDGPVQEGQEGGATAPGVGAPTGPGTGPGSGLGTGAGSVPSAVSPQAAWPEAGAPPAAGAVPAPKERRIALSGALGGKDRPRRMSCTLVLSVAGALAVATTAGVFFGVLQGPGGGGSAAEPPSGHRPSAPAQGADRGVPHAFLGTWNGSVTMANGIPNGTVSSVITAGNKGDVVVRTTYDALLVRCRAKAKLLSATDRELVLQESLDGTQGPGCTGNTSTVTYTLGANGALTFTSDDKRGGTPKATLTKSGG
ncbi:serine/threonine-protein kinase [Streptomyces sp. NPDC057743]|uniref:serine/threonine-protein kinase n=1 Tax=Streptomyces sp. NPDC057743 TaxID=3346236 RepID=UPI0036A48D4B